MKIFLTLGIPLMVFMSQPCSSADITTKENYEAEEGTFSLFEKENEESRSLPTEFSKMNLDLIAKEDNGRKEEPEARFVPTQFWMMLLDLARNHSNGRNEDSEIYRKGNWKKLTEAMAKKMFSGRIEETELKRMLDMRKIFFPDYQGKRFVNEDIDDNHKVIIFGKLG